MGWIIAGKWIRCNCYQSVRWEKICKFICDHILFLLEPSGTIRVKLEYVIFSQSNLNRQCICTHTHNNLVNRINWHHRRFDQAEKMLIKGWNGCSKARHSISNIKGLSTLPSPQAVSCCLTFNSLCTNQPHTLDPLQKHTLLNLIFLFLLSNTIQHKNRHTQALIHRTIFNLPSEQMVQQSSSHQWKAATITKMSRIGKKKLRLWRWL